jgi:hypothetical protein
MNAENSTPVRRGSRGFWSNFFPSEKSLQSTDASFDPGFWPRLQTEQTCAPPGATSLLPDRMDKAGRRSPEVKIDSFENTSRPQFGQLLFS